jgi:hypothetical protein
MPIFHYYDIWRYVYFQPTIIQKVIKPTTYCNKEHVKTFSYDILTSQQKKQWFVLCKNYYKTTETTFNLLTEQDMNIFMTGQLQPSFISFYNDYNSSISSHSYQFHYINMKPFSVYYLDFLSTKKPTSSKDLNQLRQLIQSHLYHVSYLNPNINVTIFKKIGHSISSLRSVISFSTFMYPLSNSFSLPLTDHYSIMSTNVREMIENITELDVFHWTIFPDIPHISMRIKQGLLFIYSLIHYGKSIAYYCIENEKIEIHTSNNATIHLVASYMSSSCSQENFFRGFLYICREIQKQHSTNVVTIDDCSHNKKIMERWNMEVISIGNTTDNHIYTYNLIMPTIRREHCFLLF